MPKLNAVLFLLWLWLIFLTSAGRELRHPSWGNGEVKLTGVVVYARAIFEKLIVADLPEQAESIGKA